MTDSVTATGTTSTTSSTTSTATSGRTNKNKDQNKKNSSCSCGSSSSCSSTNAIRLCGLSWTECGYCKGQRAHLATRDNDDHDDDDEYSNNNNNNNNNNNQLEQPTDQKQTEPKPAKDKGKEEFVNMQSSKSYTIVAVDDPPPPSSPSCSCSRCCFDPGLYEQLIHVGWRRSGLAFYQPDVWQSCCPSHTIRLLVQQFTPTTSQRKLINRYHRYCSKYNYNKQAPVLVVPNSNANPNSNLSMESKEPHQKRPRRGKNNNTNSNTNNHNKTITKQQEGETSLPTVPALPQQQQKQKQLVLFSDEPVFYQSGVVHQLQEWTQQALDQYLHSRNSNNTTNNQRLQETTTTTTNDSLPASAHSMSLVEPTYKVLHRPTSKQQQQIVHEFMDKYNNNNNIVTGDTYSVGILSTTVCAAIAGRSAGKIKRQELSQHVASSLRLRLQSNTITDTTSATTQKLSWTCTLQDIDSASVSQEDKKENTSTIRIEKIERHEASGQIFVYLGVRKAAATTTTRESYDGSSSKQQREQQSSSVGCATNSSCTPTTTLLTGIEMMEVDDHDKQQEQDRQPNNDATTDKTGSKPSPAPSDHRHNKNNHDEKDDVIARWYQRYKMNDAGSNNNSNGVVHNDPSYPSVQAQSFRIAGPTGDHLQHPYQMVVETVPAHESALDPQVHQLYWNYQHLVHQDPHPITNPLPETTTTTSGTPSDDKNSEMEQQEQPLSWGRLAPTTASSNGDGTTVHWTRQALAMLKQEYGHLSPQRQERLQQAFQSFYEFLVENPFATLSSSSSLARTTRCTDQSPVLFPSLFSSSAATATTTSNNQLHHKEQQQEQWEPGTYHQKYYLAPNILIAVGVVDVLPTGLSSVYLFYDPSFAHTVLPMGKLAILYEIHFCQAHLRVPYYYLGYYIHSCTKMKYKAEYKPSQLLCPSTRQWVDATRIAIPAIQRDSPVHHCCTFYKNENDSTENNSKEEVDVDKDGHNDNNKNTSDSSKKKKNKRKKDKVRNSTTASASSSSSSTAIEHIPLDVGLPQRMTMRHLAPQGQDMVRPYLEELVAHTGSTIAQQLTVKFR